MTARTEASIEKAVNLAMEIATEQVVKSVKENVEGLTPYEIERNKPMPNRIHGVLQTDIAFLIKLNYREIYQCVSELSLNTSPIGSTPDLCIYPIKNLSTKTVKAEEEEAPLTTIEIQSPSQSPEELQKKAWDLYFPMGVKSAWIVFPALKAIQLLLPDGQEFFYNSGNLKDPITNIEIAIEEVFAVLK